MAAELSNDIHRCMLQYTIHKVQAQVAGLPSTDRFTTTEERPDGVMENHWLWTQEIHASEPAEE